MSTINNQVKFKNAFKCHKCPGRNDENGCPMWWEYPQDDTNGNTRIVKECGYVALPFFLRYLATSCNRPAEEIGKMSKQIVGKVGELMVAAQQMKALENKDG